MLRRSLSLAICLAASAPAGADEELVARILRADRPCRDSTAPPAETLSICRANLQSLDSIANAGPLSQHERNLYAMGTAAIHGRIAAQMGQQDKYLSARICAEWEISWKALAPVKLEASPPEYASVLRTVRDAAVPLIKICREDYGTPGQAPPLP